jgi:transcriptional regulator with XRE-family HTH domain
MQKKGILSKLAKRIRQLRKINKMTQEQLADKADLHFTYIGEIERTEKNPTITSLEKIAKAFNISLTELVSFPDEKPGVGSNIVTLKRALKLLDFAKELGKTEIEKK